MRLKKKREKVSFTLSGKTLEILQFLTLEHRQRYNDYIENIIDYLEMDKEMLKEFQSFKTSLFVKKHKGILSSELTKTYEVSPETKKKIQKLHWDVGFRTVSVFIRHLLVFIYHKEYIQKKKDPLHIREEK